MKKIFLWLALIVFLLILLIWFGTPWMLSLSVADYNGEVSVDGITTPVDITFDARGIPQVWAANDADLYFTLGYLHASERLFQMELVRRLSKGELSEIFGAAALGTDKWQRTVGFARKAEEDIRELPPAERDILNAYCAGINAWKNSKTILPPEFFILQLEPENWKPLDCMTIMLYQTWYSHSLRNYDGRYRDLIAKLGEDLHSVLREYKTWSPATIPEGILSSLFPTPDYIPLSMSMASNSWVVSPKRSTSGAALHASDPHLQVNSIPGFWYAVGLHSPSINVLGITAPGIPFVSMGHNGRIAYAFTVAAVDIIDRVHFPYAEKDTTSVLGAAGSVKLRTIYEDIPVKDEATPRQIAIQLTSEGPVTGSDSSGVYAMKWAGYDFSVAEIMSAGMGLHNTKNFEAFRSRVTRLGALDVNWTYSDIEGNIGYQLGAPVPKRSFAGAFTQRAAGDTSSAHLGYLSIEDSPHSFNPEQGWLATCNNQIVSPTSGKAIPGFYDPYRITRASALLSEKEMYSVSDMTPMQMDLSSGVALRWKPLLQKGAVKLGEPNLAEQIASWSGDMSVEKTLPSVFTRWWHFMTREVFEDDLGEKWSSGSAVLGEVISRPLNSIVDDKRTTDKQENLIDISARALRHVLDNYKDKTYGEMSTLKVSHPIGRQVGFLDYWLNLSRGPYPIGGDDGSLNANFGRYDDENDTYRSFAGPSMRFVLDWANMDEFSMSIHLGQSGNPFSPHYDDFLEPHLRGETWRVPFSKEAVYANMKNLLTLTP